MEWQSDKTCTGPRAENVDTRAHPSRFEYGIDETTAAFVADMRNNGNGENRVDRASEYE